MCKWLPVLVLLFAAPTAAKPRETIVGRVVAVADGDTLTVQRGRDQIQVDLHGMDAPEEGQPGWAEATAALRQLVLRKAVKLVVIGKDPSGRVVAKVVVGDENVNAAMVTAGHAWAYTAVAYDYINQETNARARKLGLWSAVNPIAPWVWRDGEKPAPKPGQVGVPLPARSTDGTPTSPAPSQPSRNGASAPISGREGRGGTCTGSDPCRACSNCRYCSYCKRGGRCGACR